jgi:dihydropyrimidinase
MSEFDLVIRNGTVATAADIFAADVGISGGKIRVLGTDLTKGRAEIDAKGKLVLPGGIDSHVHIAQVSSIGIRTADDFLSGSRSAAAGGNTTLIPFAAQHKGQSLRKVVEDYHREAKGKAIVDYAFHLIISDPTPEVLGQELPALIRDGYTSFKIYLTYDMLKLSDRETLEVLSLARREGAMVMIHAENHDVIAFLTERLLAAGHSAPKFHATAHAALAEREATHRAISLAELIDVPVLIVHVSGREAIDQIAWARNRGLKIYAETCPQYLFLTEDDLDKPGIEGARCMCSPPPRDKANQEFVWRGLEAGIFDVFSSDHAPYRMDASGKLHAGPNPAFKKIGNGVPGIEVRLPLLFSEGVRTGRIDLTRFVALSATTAAKLYGLYPRKGTIAVGSDADIAIWDPELKVTIRQEILHDAMDDTPYAGREVTGWPVTTISRGEIVWNDNKVTGEAGRGRFLPCELPATAKPRDRHAINFDPTTGRLVTPS